MSTNNINLCILTLVIQLFQEKFNRWSSPPWKREGNRAILTGLWPLLGVAESDPERWPKSSLNFKKHSQKLRQMHNR